MRQCLVTGDNGCYCRHLSGVHLAYFVGHSIGELSCCGHNKRLLLVTHLQYCAMRINVLSIFTLTFAK